MKKSNLILVSLFIAFIILLSGCGSTKTLSCVMTQNKNVMTMNFVFNGKRLEDANAKYSFNISEYNQVQKEALKKSLDLCSSFKNNAVFGSDSVSNCEQEITDNFINVNAVLDIKKINEKASGNMSIDEAKKDLEKSGMICEIN